MNYFTARKRMKRENLLYNAGREQIKIFTALHVSVLGFTDFSSVMHGILIFVLLRFVKPIMQPQPYVNLRYLQVKGVFMCCLIKFIRSFPHFTFETHQKVWMPCVN